MHIPQIIYITLAAISLLIASHDHGKPRTPTNFWVSLIGLGVVFTLLIIGGFFSH